MEFLVMKIKSEELSDKVLRPNCKVFDLVSNEVADRDFNCEKHNEIPYTAVEYDNGSAWVRDECLIYLN